MGFFSKAPPKKLLILVLISLAFLSSFIFTSCAQKQTPRLLLGDKFYYWECGPESNVGQAMANSANFKKLEDKSVYNLLNTLGRGKHYVWVRADFEIPPEFKGQPLGMVIPHMSFAAQLFCNGNFISQYGSFPPHEQSTLYKAHFFSFPMNVLNQEGKNTVLIKIYVQGLSGISSHSCIQLARDAYPSFERINFNHTRVYIFFIGLLALAFILYMSVYLNIRSFKEFRDFAVVNILTSLFITYFFATELPSYTNGSLPFLPFVKFTFYIPSYFIIYFITLFAINYMHVVIPKWLRITRISVLVIQTLATIVCPSYNTFMYWAPAILTLLIIQMLLGALVMARSLIVKKSRGQAMQFLLGISPLIFTINLDIIIRIIDTSWLYPFFSVFGWQLSIVIFVVLLSIRFSKIYKNNERLSIHLQDEVDIRTMELKDANYELSLLNDRLEKDRRHAEIDLEMAALVQRNFFPHPNIQFKGWDISVCYSPAAQVSGDFYDYFYYNEILNGISLFDVSGHGLSASLVTMLSKNIISRIFQTGFRRKEPVDSILKKINNTILYEKGDIDNYMTGILCRFNDESEDSGKCSVELGNAGHPYPLKFSVQDKSVYELKGNDGKQHYGAIGMKGIKVSFARTNFLMSTGDILVLYTDGITEAANSSQEQFGVNRIKEIIINNHARPAEEIKALIIDALEKFTEYQPLDDDITLIIAKRTNKNEFIHKEESYEDFAEPVEELEALDEAEE
ncbi:MAG: SpoIIE family protein phosphatase [Treponema sp.]|nr:SpoIIE family protein phosphatase [Treponema sp.]